MVRYFDRFVDFRRIYSTGVRPVAIKPQDGRRVLPNNLEAQTARAYHKRCNPFLPTNSLSTRNLGRLVGK